MQGRIINNIEHIRKSHFLNNKAFCEAINISYTSYHKIKKHETKATLETLVKISEAFDINLHDLVFTDMTNKSDIVKTDNNNLNDVLIDYARRLEDLESKVK